MNDHQLEDLLRRTADRVPADPRLAETVGARFRRARRRRRTTVVAAGTAVLAVVSVLVVGPIRGWLPAGDVSRGADIGVVAAEPPSPTGLDAWRWRDVPDLEPPMTGEDGRLFVVGRSLVALGREAGHYVAAVSEPVGEPFDPYRPAPDTVMTLAAHAASDTTLYFWGGQDSNTSGSLEGPSYPQSDLAFDVTTQTWSKLPPAPVASRDGAVAVWTGSRLVVWGGWLGAVPTQGTPVRVLSDGAVYDPASSSWEVLPPAPGDGNLVPVGAVWVDGRVVIWTNAKDQESRPEAGRTLVYDPAARSWTEAPGPPVIAGGASFVATTNGAVAISVLLEQTQAARFDAATARWIPLDGPRIPDETICPSSTVTLRDLAAARTVAAVVLRCEGGIPQVLDETSGEWSDLESWGSGKAITGVPASGENFLTTSDFSNLMGQSSIGAGSGLRILAP